MDIVISENLCCDMFGLYIKAAKKWVGGKSNRIACVFVLVYDDEVSFDWHGEYCDLPIEFGAGKRVTEETNMDFRPGQPDYWKKYTKFQAHLKRLMTKNKTAKPSINPIYSEQLGLP